MRLVGFWLAKDPVWASAQMRQRGSYGYFVERCQDSMMVSDSFGVCCMSRRRKQLVQIECTQRQCSCVVVFPCSWCSVQVQEVAVLFSAAEANGSQARAPQCDQRKMEGACLPAWLIPSLSTQHPKGTSSQPLHRLTQLGEISKYEHRTDIG